MPFLKFEERNGVFWKNCSFFAKIFFNKKKKGNSFNLSTISKIVSFMYFSYLFENGQNCFVSENGFFLFRIQLFSHIDIDMK